MPLRPGTPRSEYLARYDESLDAALAALRPDLILVSSGFDVLAGDPLGGQMLEPEDMHTLTTRLMERAAEVCGGRVVVLLEGGYDVRRTGEGAVQVLRALAGITSTGQTLAGAGG